MEDLDTQPDEPLGESRSMTRQPFIEVMDDAMADVLRQKTPAERLDIAARMWKSARVMLRGAIRTAHPDWSEEHVNREIARRISHGVVTHESG